jgi:hypothetical protein
MGMLPATVRNSGPSQEILIIRYPGTRCYQVHTRHFESAQKETIASTIWEIFGFHCVKIMVRTGNFADGGRLNSGRRAHDGDEGIVVADMRSSAREEPHKNTHIRMSNASSRRVYASATAFYTTKTQLERFSKNDGCLRLPCSTSAGDRD